MKTSLMSLQTYDPNRLFDTVAGNQGLKNDHAIAVALEVSPPVISKMRNRRLPVGATMLIRLHELTGMTIRDLRFLMGDERPNFR